MKDLKYRIPLEISLKNENNVSYLRLKLYLDINSIDCVQNEKLNIVKWLFTVLLVQLTELKDLKWLFSVCGF